MTESSSSLFSSSPSNTVPLYFDHTVSSDSETLRSIAVRFDISLTELRQTNRLSSFDTIFKGKVLKIPNVHNYSGGKFHRKFLTQQDLENTAKSQNSELNIVNSILNQQSSGPNSDPKSNQISNQNSIQNSNKNSDQNSMQSSIQSSLQNSTISKSFEKRSSIHDLLNTDLLSFQTSNLSVSDPKTSELTSPVTHENHHSAQNSTPNQAPSIEEDAGFIKTHATLLPNNISGSLIITDSALMFDPDDRTDQELAIINPISEIAWMECVKCPKNGAVAETNKKLEVEFGRMNSLLRSISDYLLDEDSEDSDLKNSTFLLMKMSLEVEFQYFEISGNCVTKVFNLLSDSESRETRKLILQTSLSPPVKTKNLSCYTDFRARVMIGTDLQPNLMNLQPNAPNNYKNMQTNWFLQNKQNLQQVQKNYEKKTKLGVKPEFSGIIDHDYVVIKETNSSFEFPSIENFDDEYTLPELRKSMISLKSNSLGTGSNANPSAGDEIDFILSDSDSGNDLEPNFHLKVLTKWLPDSVAGVSQWRLIFDSEKQGHSLASIYRICDKEKRKQMNNVLIIESVDGDYFGAFLTELPRPVEPHAVYKHYGSGESFLFNLNGQKSRKYSWTGSNNFISTGDSEHFAIGGGRGTHGVWFDAKLCEGSSQACDTFGNESSIAGGKRDFIVSGMQLWVLE